ncbi:MAG: recombinase family protein [Actinomycetia bacterium]|nr:recombinase family protein [Actinomycetes bacterium]
MTYGKEESRSQGHWQGGKPFGYKRGADPGSLEVVPERAEAVRLMFELRAEGWSYPAIGDELDRLGMRGQRRARMQHSSVQTILNNPVYIGFGTWNGEWYPLNPELCPPIIDRGFWDRVQVIEQARGKGTIKRGRYICSGLLKCAACGSPMVRRIRYKESGSQIKKNGGRKTVSAVDYYCFSAHNPVEAKRRGYTTPCPENGAMIRETIIEDYVTGMLLKRVNDELLKTKIDGWEDNGDDDTEFDDPATTLRRKLGQLKAKEGRLLDIYSDGEINKTVLGKKMRAVTAQMAELQKELAAIENGQALQRQAIEEIASFDDLETEWPQLAPDIKAAIVSRVIKEVIIQPGGRGVHNGRVRINWA